ncbi:MAG: tRNA (adenosine(37)-N6)-threonylcarbamoyltransferase complex ATPase subunit type 1 TsaE [Kordia sp.]|nr:MAG: tRNA (adenosine(37)-N6)-threonylcarbamoyltransferase complex ATPase subunit type 1 TsaE [Kordia sp.]
MKLTYHLTELKDITTKILTYLETPRTLLFYGEMGVGKTTLIKELAKQLGVTEATSSPTFSLVNEYQGSNNTVFHFDFYRIENEVEVYDIGIEDYFYQNSWCLVEWPEKIPKIIPEDAITIKIHKNSDETRTLEISAR